MALFFALFALEAFNGKSFDRILADYRVLREIRALTGCDRREQLSMLAGYERARSPRRGSVALWSHSGCSA
jgi:hypothetical protein